MKRLQIILEGPDASGKTTQFKGVWSKIQSDNNYQLLLNDRGLMSILAYGILNNRFKDTDEVKAEFLEYLHSNIIIYLIIKLWKINIEVYIKSTSKTTEPISIKFFTFRINAP